MQPKQWLSRLRGHRCVGSILSSIFVVLSTVLLVGAADYTTTEVWRGYGFTGMDLGHPQINSSGQILWVGDDNGGQIYFYSYGTITQISNGITGNGYPMINDRGQCIWREISGINGIDNVYLYYNGSITQVANDAVHHEYLQINNCGQIAWSSSGSDNQIYLYDDGVTTQITNNSDKLSQTNSPSINIYGQIAFIEDNDIYLYVKGSITQITNNGSFNGRPRINDLGEIVWFGFDGLSLEINLYQNDTIFQLTNNIYNDFSPEINARGQVVWFGSDGHDQEIYLYSDDGVRQITNNAYDDHEAKINDNGLIVWVGSDGQYDQIFTYYDGTITQITNTAYSNYEPMINDSGQIVWYAFEGNNLVLYEANPAKLTSYSRYDFNYYYNDGSGDYYTGYVYAPTALLTSGPYLTIGTSIYNQPAELNYQSLNGGYYNLTAITDGFDAAYDKKSYITAYYDGDTAMSVLGVNTDGSATAGSIYVADRTAAWESGYAISGSNHAAFNPYTEADVTLTVSSPALASAPPSPPATIAGAARSQAVWAAYWSQTAGLLDEEQYR